MINNYIITLGSPGNSPMQLGLKSYEVFVWSCLYMYIKLYKANFKLGKGVVLSLDGIYLFKCLQFDFNGEDVEKNLIKMNYLILMRTSPLRKMKRRMFSWVTS